MPTDTLYGVLGKTEEDVVERIYGIKERDKEKPFIVLISSISDLKLFKLKGSSVLKNLWPGEVSVVLPCKNLPYLHRGKEKIAFRVPESKVLRSIIRKTGPLVAPSANKEGDNPVIDIEEAVSVFGAEVDFYVDGGTIKGDPSTLVELKNGEVKVLRKGKINL